MFGALQNEQLASNRESGAPQCAQFFIGELGVQREGALLGALALAL